MEKGLTVRKELKSVCHCPREGSSIIKIFNIYPFVLIVVFLSSSSKAKYS